MSPDPIQKASFCQLIHATHRATVKEVAIKVVDKKSTSEKMLVQFRVEAAIIGRLKHNNILKLIELIETPSTLYIVMQYYRGGDLQTFMQCRDYEPLPEVIAK